MCEHLKNHVVDYVGIRARTVLGSSTQTAQDAPIVKRAERLVGGREKEHFSKRPAPSADAMGRTVYVLLPDAREREWIKATLAKQAARVVVLDDIASCRRATRVTAAPVSSSLPSRSRTAPCS